MQHSYSKLSSLCQEILNDVEPFSQSKPKVRLDATKNRSRCLLLAETQKVADRYNKIGEKYRMKIDPVEESFPQSSSIAVNELIRRCSWSESLKDRKLTVDSIPPDLEKLNIPLSPLANPDPYADGNAVFPLITVDELRKLHRRMNNRSFEKLLTKYEGLVGQKPSDDIHSEIVTELKAALITKSEIETLGSIIFEYEGFDAALKANPASHAENADMLSKFKCLHFQAAAALPNFEKLISAINKLGLVNNESAVHGEESKDSGEIKDLDQIHASTGPLKLMSRSSEKAINDYNRDPCRILDFLRASAYCTSVGALNKVINFLETVGKDQYGVHILRIKNGFQPLIAVDTYGYRDVKVNVWVPCNPMLVSAGGCLDPSRAGLVAEIQLHIQEMYDVKHEIGS
jgi:hypothetical protein